MYNTDAYGTNLAIWCKILAVTDKIIIVGAGLIGLTTAFELASRGHLVQVIEDGDQVGQLTSFANGGLLVPSSSFPWNRPGFHRHLFNSIFGAESAVIVRAAAMPAMIPWLVRFIRHCSASKHLPAMQASYRLAAWSIHKMGGLRAQTNIQYDACLRGSLKVCRTQEALDEATAQASLLRPFGLRFEVLDREQTVAVEPALSAIAGELQGSVFAPDDEGGDAALFCQGLGDEIVKLGGEICLNTAVTGIKSVRSAISAVETSRGPITADRVVVCAGNTTRALLKPCGIRIAVCPVKGYSLTLNIEEGVELPAIPIMDDAMYGGVITLGRRLRVAGVAEFGGMDLSDNDACTQHLFKLLQGLFPRVAQRINLGIDQGIDQSSATRWAGIRPVSADGLPYIGESPLAGLWVNSGHGSLGFTMAAGSAGLLADLIDGRKPEIDPAPYSVVR